jgi:hypothetical protein
MTGIEAYDEVVFKLREEGFNPPTPERFLAVLNGKMRDLNSFTPVYWRRQILPTVADCRFLLVPPGIAILSIINGSMTDTSAHTKWGLVVMPSMQFSGVGHDTTADGVAGPPKRIWLEHDHARGYIFFAFDRRPDAVYTSHLKLHYRIPAYTDPAMPLPVHELVHPVIVEGVLSDLSETDDFHRKSLHVEHLQLYERGRLMARNLVARSAESQRDQVDRFSGARRSCRDESY